MVRVATPSTEVNIAAPRRARPFAPHRLAIPACTAAAAATGVGIVIAAAAVVVVVAAPGPGEAAILAAPIGRMAPRLHALAVSSLSIAALLLRMAVSFAFARRQR